MSAPIRKWDDPDETIEFGGGTSRLISIGGLTVSQDTLPPGWRWREHFQPLVGGDSCQAHHVGVVLEGRIAVVFQGGTQVDYGPGDLYDMAPGHDSWVIGDEPCVMIEWSGSRRWMAGATTHRTLASLLFTDIVDSTRTASLLGDASWHDLLAVHYQQADEAIERLGGRRIKTTGDGLLASFEGAAAAVRCAVAVRDAAARQHLPLRLGVHVGEVELVGDDVRGVAVHQAARVMGAAGAAEILVSEAVRLLCQGLDLTFEDAGEHELKGVPDTWHLYRVVNG